MRDASKAAVSHSQSSHAHAHAHPRCTHRLWYEYCHIDLTMALDGVADDVSHVSHEPGSDGNGLTTAHG